MGNAYVRDEFRRHAKADEHFVEGFIKEWQAYKSQLEQQIRLFKDMIPNSISKTTTTAAQRIELGKNLDKETLDALSDQQIGQLFELRKETEKRRK